MRVLIAPTAFKGSLSPLEVAQAMQSGVQLFCTKYNADILTDILPLADGGDGTVESIYAACGGTLVHVNVIGAFNEERHAVWLLGDNIAFVELASASGISGWNKEQLRPLDAHTKGLGQVIRDVVDKAQAQTIVITLGGSASTDGGIGALSVLGAKFFDDQGRIVDPIGGRCLARIRSCDLTECKALLQKHKFIVATDVENPLLGPLGAAHIFGPQKNCSLEDIDLLDRSLAQFADVIELAGQSKGARDKPGAGAAGGTAFGLSVALNADIVSGFDYLSNLLDLNNRFEKADLVFTGEGLIDLSTLSGKAVGSLQKLAKQFGTPLWAFSAATVSENDSLLSSSFDKLISIARPGEYADERSIADCVFRELDKHFGNAAGHQT